MKCHSLLLASISGLLLLFSACSKEPSVETYKVPKAPAKVSVEAAQVDLPTGLPFKWAVPGNWVVGADAPMRLISYEVPLANEVGDFSIVQLGGTAGGITANVNRWRGQIGLGSVSPADMGQISHIHMTSQGVAYHHITLINDANPSAAIAAAIFERSDYVLFVKLNASTLGIQEARPDFEAFCNSISFNEG